MADHHWIGGGANANWNTVGNWSATAGGASNGTTPSSTSDVFFDGAGVNGNTNSTISAIVTIVSLTFSSGYTAQVTRSAVLTISTSFTDHTAHTWAGASALTLSGTGTITSNGQTWSNNVTFTGGATKTLSGNWSVGGSLTVSASTVLNSGTINVAGGLIVNSSLSGTGAINMTGGTWSGTNVTLVNLTLNSGVTVSGTVSFNTGTLTGASGVTTTGSTLLLSGTSTLDTNGISWNNISITATITVTLNSLLTVLGTLSNSGNFGITFAGTAGFDVGTLRFDNASSTNGTHTFVNNVTYLIRTSLLCFRSVFSSIVTITSNHATNKAIITLSNGAICNVMANFTRIDASGGRPILTFNGVVATSTNVFAYTDVQVQSPRLVRLNGRRKNIYNRAKTVQYQ